MLKNNNEFYFETIIRIKDLGNTMKIINTRYDLKALALSMFLGMLMMFNVNASIKTWTGNVSTDWFNSDNWSPEGAPNYDSVIVPTTPLGGRFPTLGGLPSNQVRVYTLELKSNATFTQTGSYFILHDDLIIRSGATFHQQDGTLLLYNDWMNYGTFTSDSGYTVLGNCSSLSDFSSGINDFYDLGVSTSTTPKFDNNPSSLIKIKKGFYNYGNYSVSSDATFLFNGTGNQPIYNQTAAGNAALGNFVIDKPSGSVILKTSSLEVSGNVTVDNGTLDLDTAAFKRTTAGGTLSLNNESELTIGKNYPTNFSNEVLSIKSVINYDAKVDQNVRYGFINGTVKLSGGGTKSAEGDMTVNSNVEVLPGVTFDMKGYPLTVNGALHVEGSFVSTNPAGIMSFYSKNSGNYNLLNTWANSGYNGATTTRLPGVINNDVLIVGNNKTLNLTSNVNNLGTIRIDTTGTLNTASFTLGGPGLFDIRDGGFLKITSPYGLDSTLGDVVTELTKFGSFTNFAFVGTSAQITGNRFPAKLNHLIIYNINGVTLTNSAQLSGDLTLTQGRLLLNSKNLTLSSVSSILGSLSSSNMIVTDGVGQLRKEFTSAGSFTFPIGDNTGTAEYSPVTLNFTSGTFSSAYAGVNVVNAKHPQNTSTSNYLNRYWTVSSLGISSFSCDVTFTYVDADVQPGGSEASIYGAQYEGSWNLLNPVNASTNQISYTVSSFSDFTGGESTALPVELVSFNASVVNNSVNLNWKTATEINNYGFEILRFAQNDSHSEEGTDEESWEKIGFVSGYGNSNSLKEYSFTDSKLSSGSYSYRLKQIDNDGSYTYSNVVNVTIDNTPNNFELSQNYPNPFNPSTKIRYAIPLLEGNASGDLVTLKVYDILGNEVATLVNEAQSAGVYEVDFDGSKLSSGAYVYRIQSGKFSEIKKMILNK